MLKFVIRDTLKLFPKQSNGGGIYRTKKFQDKQALDSTKYCRVWEIMVITEHVNVEFRVYDLILSGILANLGTRKLEITEF